MKNILTKKLRCLRQNGGGTSKTCAAAILPKGHFFFVQLAAGRHLLKVVRELTPERVNVLSAGAEEQIHGAMAFRTASIQVLDDGRLRMLLQPSQEPGGNAIPLSVGVSIRINRKRKTIDILLEILVPNVVSNAF